MDEIVGFLWSPCIKLWDTIIERMVDDDILVEYSIFDFEEKISEYESAILEIYRTDDISLESQKCKNKCNEIVSKFICQI